MDNQLFMENKIFHNYHSVTIKLLAISVLQPLLKFTFTVSPRSERTNKIKSEHKSLNVSMNVLHIYMLIGKIQSIILKHDDISTPAQNTNH